MYKTAKKKKITLKKSIFAIINATFFEIYFVTVEKKHLKN